jgi:acetyltransferase-like isoleucine patch superfamily enzyme
MKYSLLRFIKNILKLSRSNISYDFALFDKTSIIQEPAIISKASNIYVEENVNIGVNSILYAISAKIYIKKYFIAANGLRISTGNHERRIGKFLASITEKEKNHNLGLDKDVIINEDVWAGFNVTILAGVVIGRGCTLGAGSVVTHSLPPYSVCAGNPAKFIKFYWTIEQILEHETLLYPIEQRYTKDQLVEIYKNYNS